MNALEFIQATDNKTYYFDSFLKTVVYGYQQLVKNEIKYNRKDVHNKIKEIYKSDTAYNELEDYLCTDLVKNFIKPNLSIFGLENLVVDVGVRETLNNVTTGHLDIKFQVPSLSNSNYYAIEAKRIDKNNKKQNYYISGGIKRFTERKYYPESNTVVAGMVGFVEIEFPSKVGKRLAIPKIVENLNGKLISDTSTESLLSYYPLSDSNYKEINDFLYSYVSKHTRDDDSQSLKIYHIFLDYYDLVLD